MNMLQTISNTNNDELTMGTREIAEMLGKQHGHIKVSAERLVKSGVILTLATREFHHNGNTYTEYRLGKRDSLVLVAQNCPEFTASIVDRWQELEQQASKTLQLPNFTDPIAACEAWMVQYKKSTELEGIVLREAPKVEFYDSFVDAKELLTMEEAAKQLGMGRNKFMDYLRSIKALTNANLPVQRLIDDCKFQVKYTPWKSGNKQGTQHTPMLTAKGLLLLKKRMLRDGVITE